MANSKFGTEEAEVLSDALRKLDRLTAAFIEQTTELRNEIIKLEGENKVLRASQLILENQNEKLGRKTMMKTGAKSNVSRSSNVHRYND